MPMFQRSIMRQSSEHSMSMSAFASVNVTDSRSSFACCRLSQRFVSIRMLRYSSGPGRDFCKCASMPLNFLSPMQTSDNDACVPKRQSTTGVGCSVVRRVVFVCSDCIYNVQ